MNDVTNKYRHRRSLVDEETGYYTEPPASQAEAVIRKFGGVYEMAAALGVKPSTVYRWTYPPGKQGTGGIIPSRKREAVKRAARREGILITKEDWSAGEII